MHPLFDPVNLSDEDIYKLSYDLSRRLTIAFRTSNNQNMINQLRLMIETIDLIKQERSIKTINDQIKNNDIIDTEEYWFRSQENSKQWKFNTYEDPEEEKIKEATIVSERLSEQQQKFQNWQASRTQPQIEVPEPKKRGRPRKEKPDIPVEPKKRGRPRKIES